MARGADFFTWELTGGKRSFFQLVEKQTKPTSVFVVAVTGEPAATAMCFSMPALTGIRVAAGHASRRNSGSEGERGTRT
ncbi:hypothetical protein, partial [Nocardiopsis sp. L17-MgMaSL7]|uniref:hypothetical protein n=1 Tax=Nocardiopsis sp. L17-MgMaSL7 TaxID=1938893 RepID=UPI001F2EC697